MTFLKRIKKLKLTIIPILLGLVFAVYGSVEDKLAVTMEHMQSIGSAIEAYMEDKHELPETFSIDELAGLLEQGYIKDCPRRDAWGKKFAYAARLIPLKNDGADAQYWLGSGGTAGEFGGFLPTMTKAAPNETDIIYSNGKFTGMLPDPIAIA